jgi:Zn-dependent alcohol dehydrogenase
MVSASVCHTDCFFKKGIPNAVYQAKFPAVFGHEGVGIVESVGDGVTHIKQGKAVKETMSTHDIAFAGDHVIPYPIPQCGKCCWCTSKKTNRCMANA